MIIAEALDHCSTVGFTSYNNLNAYTVFFDEVKLNEPFDAYICLLIIQGC